MGAPGYKAFISYSHRDERWARWLQRALESYRIPPRLAGRQTPFGPIPARLRPVFRDREDLSSASDLSTQIKEELSRSETLVVICSPSAAKSRWVNEEIRYFRQLGRGDRIFPLVVAGDPHARDGEEACFPPAQLESASGVRHEPLAADVRRHADGKRLALLKIIAAILGVRLDELRQRDAQRRVRRLAIALAAAVLVTSIIAWLTYSQIKTRAAAEVQLANTEVLLRFMLGDLERLDPIPGVERISPSDEEQQRRRADLGLADLDDETLMQQTLAWRKEGQELQWQGQSQAALERFLDSRAAIVELYQRDSKDRRLLFELAQAEYYVGEAHVERGELDRAHQHWTQYGALARRLVNSEPNNPRYIMELSYTLMNIGALEQQRAVPDTSKTLEAIQAAVQYNQMALVLDPNNLEYRDSLMNQLAWLADAWREKCALGKALESRQQSVELHREALAGDPDDSRRQKGLASTLSGLAGMQQEIGLNRAAVGSWREVVQILGQLHQAEPANADIEWEMLYREARMARLLLATGLFEQASEIIARLAPRITVLAGQETGRDQLHKVQAVHFELDQARLALEYGETERGRHLLREATLRMAELVRGRPGFRPSLEGLVMASFLYWEQHGAKPDIDLEGLLGDYLAEPEAIENCFDADLAARMAVMDGDLSTARSLSRYVLGKGYFEADFVAFCRRHATCDLR
jgi:tetratricopeptide (TPR) repeat protein